MGNDHSIQIVLVVSGDTEEVQLMALLIISDLQQSTAIAQNSSALRFGKDHSPETRYRAQQKPSSPPGNTEPLNHLFIPAHT